VHTSTWPGGCSRSRRGRVPKAQAGERKAWGKPQAFVTGCELDDVLAQTDGNIGVRTGLQRARSSHRCFGICAPHGARAGEVHGLPCRMSDVASIMRATCQSLVGAASASQSCCHGWKHAADAPQGGLACGGSGPPPDGLTADGRVSKRRCVWNRPVYGRIRVRSQTSVNGTEIDAIRTLRATL